MFYLRIISDKSVYIKIYIPIKYSTLALTSSVQYFKGMYPSIKYAKL